MLSGCLGGDLPQVSVPKKQRLREAGATKATQSAWVGHRGHGRPSSSNFCLEFLLL